MLKLKISLSACARVEIAESEREGRRRRKIKNDEKSVMRNLANMREEHREKERERGERLVLLLQAELRAATMLSVLR